MKRISKKITTAAVLGILFLAFSNTAFSQPPQRRSLPDSSRITTLVDTLSAQLKLNAEQKKKVSEIYFASFAELKSDMKKNRGHFQAMRKARQEAIEKRDKQIKELLTDDQKKAYDKIIAQQRENRRRRWQDRRPPQN